jgi:hypothetical protein
MTAFKLRFQSQLAPLHQDVHFFSALIPFFQYVPIMRAAVDDIFPIMVGRCRLTLSNSS